MNNQSEMIKHMTDKEILFHLYMTQLALVSIGTLGAFFLFDDFHHFQSIWKLNIVEIMILGGLIGIAVIGLDLILMRFLPTSLFDDGGINKRVFEKRSIPHIFILCFIIAFSEEWLFRGVIQTHFGLFIASILFAVTHIRYMTKWLLFTLVTALSFLFGWLYSITGNLFITIFAHFLIDFVFGVKIRLDYVKGTANKTEG
jgi:uncharacterized protein